MQGGGIFWLRLYQLQCTIFQVKPVGEATYMAIVKLSTIQLRKVDGGCLGGEVERDFALVFGINTP